MKKIFKSIFALSLLAFLAPIPAKAHLLTYEHSHGGETPQASHTSPEIAGYATLVFLLILVVAAIYRHYSKKVH